MADRLLVNHGEIAGDYNQIPFSNTRSSEVTVRLAEIPFEKTADQTMWFSGNLTYTLKIDNTAGEGPLEDVVVTDQLDTTMFSLDQDSIVVTIGTETLVLNTDYTVTYSAGGLLTIEYDETRPINVGSISTITFSGAKVPA